MEALQRAIVVMKTGTRLTERRNAAQKLESILQQDTDDVCKLLDINSIQAEKTKGYEKITWTKLFVDVQEYFEKELSNDRQVTAQNRVAFISVVRQVFTKATRNRPWLDWHKPLNFITKTLKDERLVKLYGSSMISLLELFLSVEMYKELMDEDAWMNLFETLIRCHKKGYYATLASILNCMASCIVHASSHPGVITALRRRVVQFYCNLIDTNRSVLKEDILPYLEGLISLCQLNASEFRTILCKAGETILPTLIGPSALREEQEVALIEFFACQYALHMPCDVAFSSDAFYAYDLQKWKEIVKSMYSYCIDSIEESANKSNRLRPGEIKIPKGLLHLAAKCTKQISSSAFAESDISEGEEEGASKKTMRYKSFSVIISDVSRRPVSEGLFVWLRYLSEVLDRFPELVDSKMTFSNLINVGSSLYTGGGSGRNTTRSEFYAYFSSLLNVERHLQEKGTLTEVSEAWNLVWEATIKSIPGSKDKPGACSLLRKILKYIRPNNVNLLLSAFLDHSMPSEQCTVDLLAEFLSNCSVPVQMKCSVHPSQSMIVDEEITVTSNARVTLLKWLLKTWNETPGGCDHLAPLMCSLAVKQSHALILKEIDLNMDSNEGYMDFEEVLLKSCFVKADTDLVKPKKSAQTDSELSGFKFIIQENLAERIVESIQMELASVPPLQIKASEFASQGNYKKYLSKLTLCLNVLNVMEKYFLEQPTLGLSEHQPRFISIMRNVVDDGIQRCDAFMVGCFDPTNGIKNPDRIQQLVDGVGGLLRNASNLCKSVQAKLGQGFSAHSIAFTKQVFRSNLSRYIDSVSNNLHAGLLYVDDELPSRLRMIQLPNAAELDIITRDDRRYESMSMAAIRMLTDYGIIGDNMDLLNEIMQDLIAENVGSTCQYFFDACVEVILRSAKKIFEVQAPTVIQSVLGILQKCCRFFHFFPKCFEKIWIMFKEITPAIAASDGETRRKFMILVGTCYVFFKKGQPLNVSERAFEAISTLAKYDTSSTWAVFQPGNSPTIWILEDLYPFIAGASQRLRMMAVDAICEVFKHALPYDYSDGPFNADSVNQNDYQEKRRRFLESLYNQIVQSYDVDANLSGDEICEESMNRTCTTLSCLSRLIFAFPYTRKTIIIYLFLIVKLKSIDIKVTSRALNYASPDALKTIGSHLSYILKKTLQLKESVEELPHELFGCDSKAIFLKTFQKEICAELFQQNEMPQLELVARRLGTVGKDLVQESYGLIMARVTPALTILHYQLAGFQNQRLVQSNAVHKRLIDTLGGKSVTDALLAKYLGDVVLNLISLTFEPNVTTRWGVVDVKMTEPVPPHYPESVIGSCLEFLQSISPNGQVTVIGYLARTSHDTIYKILLHLRIRIHNSHDELELYWRLHHFGFFVDLLLKEPPEIFLTMKEYVCNFVFSTYLKLLKSERSTNQIQLKKVIMFLLKDVIEKLIDEYLDEMLVFFDQIVREIVSVVRKSPELIPSAQEILDFLLVQHVQTFGKLIQSLDPFPANIPEFHQYSMIQLDKKYGNRRAEWSLSRELEALLQLQEGNTNTCTKERLQFLKELLVERKRDLDRMVRNLENKQFSEECQSEPLHSLIQMLIGIILSCKEEDMVKEACRCLGEIGPVNLSVLVLPQHKRQGRINDKNQAQIEIIKIISGFLKSEDISIVVTAGKVLKSLLKFEECSTVLKNDMAHAHLSNALKPFHCIYPSQRRKSNDKIDSSILEQKLGLNEMDEGIDFKSWLIKLTVGLIECFKEDSSFVTHFIPLCEAKVEFCESIFPYVVYLTLYGGRSSINVKRTLTGYFRNFFSKFVAHANSSTESSRSFTPSSFGSTHCSIYMNKLALRSLLRAIQFLRRHPVPQEMKGKILATPWDSNFWMDINYLDVARAAQYCGAYLTSIMYTEIAATEMEASSGGGSSSSSDSRSSEDDSQEEFYSQGVSVRNRSEAAKIEKLLLKAYTSIGEPDAAYGCGSARFSDTESSMHHMVQKMDWHRLLMLANGSYINPESSNESQVALSMKQLGMYNVLWDYLKGVEKIGTGVLPEELTQIQYECGWRLTKWDLNTDKPAYIKDLVESSTFQMSIYHSIQNGLIEDKSNHLNALDCGYKNIHNDLKHATLESSENLYGFMSRLQMLRVVEDFFMQTEDGNGSVGTFLRKWKLQDKIPASDFKYQEPPLFIRNVLLRAYDQRKPVNLEGEISESLLDLIAKAREAGRLDFAESCATAMSSLCSKPSIPRELEVAKNNWARGSAGADVARDIMSKLIKKCPADEAHYPALLLLYGEWLSKSHCERPTVILEKYLQKSCTMYESRRSSASLQESSKAYIVLAKYADAQYQNVTKYISSDVFQAKIEYMKTAKKSVEDMKHSNSSNPNQKQSLTIQLRHCNNDQEEIEHIRREQRNFLELALKYYLRGLKTSSDNDLLIFRAISLWLENEDEVEGLDLVGKTTKIFGEEKMPSYKYIVVLHQLSARLTKDSSARNSLLREILVKCAEDHPYHTLPVILTQANLHQDEKSTAKNSSSKVSLADRVGAAASIVAELKKNSKLNKLVSKMEVLWLALINLANIQDRASNASGIDKNIPVNVIKQLKDMSLVVVPTCTVPVLQSGNYRDSIVCIEGFESKYGLVGGINSPKKIKCRGSNGIVYNMLLKGQDDLRQDAVMQQVFGVMNRLLQVEQNTRVRRLHIRTYKVIPLSQRTGVIEWVENTQTLGEYLSGDNQNDHGAHGRYRPKEYKPMDCRRLMLDARQKDFEHKYTTYVNICENFKPVFRHFFFENFKESGVFFEKRLAYTRSVATTSIVGYILGLGDRHVLNILIDKTTAEFIHIDLGVAFEQGRILPTPETIPFRLTRDVVDGMGVSGVEGVFKRSCEMTMEVLRNNAEIIITVLQVLLYDPLYMWALTNDRVAKVQPSDARNGKSGPIQVPEDSAKERNNSAMRVLLRLRQKLMGIEEEGGATGAISSGCSLSIDGHVALLIQRAIDPKKLCRLFPGWQPYL